MTASQKDLFVVATEDLYLPGGQKQYSPGMLVPAENVERNGWQDGVAKVGTKDANEAAKQLPSA